MDKEYRDHVREIALGCGQSIKEDMDKSDALYRAGKEDECEDFEEEMKSNFWNPCSAWIENGKPRYEIQLAGPHTGSCYVWIEGDLSEQYGGFDPCSAHLRYNGCRGQDLLPEWNNTFASWAGIVLGDCYDLIETWDEHRRERAEDLFRNHSMQWMDEDDLRTMDAVRADIC